MIRCLFRIAILGIAISTVASVRAMEPAGESGFVAPAVELRVVVADSRVPDELVGFGLVRASDDGRVESGLAGSWEMLDRGARWRFELRQDLRFADGSTVRSADVLAALKSPKLRRFFSAPLRSGSADSSGFTLLFKRGDPFLVRRLSDPRALLVSGKGGGWGAYEVVSRVPGGIALRRNAFAIDPPAHDTLVLVEEPDRGRGIYLVNAGRADITEVEDDDLGRAGADAGDQGRLVAGTVRQIHALLPRKLTYGATLMLRRAVDRPAIASTLFSGYAASVGPAFKELAPEERRGIPAKILVEDLGATFRNFRVLPRILYDLRRSGLKTETTSASRTASVAYQVAWEGALPRSAVPLLAVTPQWYVHRRVTRFDAGRDFWEAVRRAEVRP